MRVRYLSVEVDRSLGQLAQDAATPGDQGTHTLLPIGQRRARRHARRRARQRLLARAGGGLPRYSAARSPATTSRRSSAGTAPARASARPPRRAARRGGAAAVAHAAGKVKDAVTGDHHSYEHDDYDDQRLYAPRRQQGLAGSVGGNVDVAGRQGEQRLTLAEEQLAVGKRETSAGEVELRKTVETERVQEQVQLRHDEVTVERRP
jgi:hypothetical protein